jgi:alpha/beta superfamily hydrolase
MKPVFLLVVALLVITQAEAADRESTVCGAIQERFLFWLWSSAAPKPDKNRALSSELIKPAAYTTTDGKTLRGYQYSAHNIVKQKTAAKGYVLLALGNAMIADQIITSVAYLAEQGYDVYIFDYRGYGNSEGKRRINAIIEDYTEIISSLNAKYDRTLLYGISLGGAIMLNAIGAGADYDIAVIDSSPSKFSDYGCPPGIDPINNLPADASKLFVITSKKDQVLNADMTSLLRIEAKNRGATVLDGEFSHPYMDSDTAAIQQRTDATRMFFFKTQRSDN